jgi:DNA-directed RNA polymerase subunit RPC12/RpoP
MGDPACFLRYTCFECGLMLEPADRAGAICPRCGAEFEIAEEELSTLPDR